MIFLDFFWLYIVGSINSLGLEDNRGNSGRISSRLTKERGHFVVFCVQQKISLNDCEQTQKLKRRNVLKSLIIHLIIFA